jgi:pilus assembly protein CpaC
MKKFISVGLFLLLGQFAYAENQSISLSLGESKLLKVRSADQTTIDDSTIASYNAISDSEILLSGKSAGKTKITYTSTAGEKEEVVINVSSRLSKKPMIEVGVEIMEIDSQSALQAGLSWGSITNSAGSTTTTLNNVSITEGAPPSLVSLGSFTRDSLTASIQLLLNRGKAKILSKPKLLTVSGEEASFLAGGEIPYATENKVGATNVEWKPYGVKLKIKPTIDGSENIAANLRAEVSEIDNANGIVSSGIVIPALKTRWAETSVYMKSGNTLVIAGLIEEENQKTTSGLPLISDIPILGELFRFTNDQKSQTELVIFVTPTLIGENNT